MYCFVIVQVSVVLLQVIRTADTSDATFTKSCERSCCLSGEPSDLFQPLESVNNLVREEKLNMKTGGGSTSMTRSELTLMALLFAYKINYSYNIPEVHLIISKLKLIVNTVS